MSACCDMMHANTTDTCDQHPSRFDCPDALIVRWPDGYYGIIVHDGGRSAVRIAYCPWCSAKLPEKV